MFHWSPTPSTFSEFLKYFVTVVAEKKGRIHVATRGAFIARARRRRRRKELGWGQESRGRENTGKGEKGPKTNDYVSTKNNTWREIDEVLKLYSARKLLAFIQAYARKQWYNNSKHKSPFSCWYGQNKYFIQLSGGPAREVSIVITARRKHNAVFCPKTKWFRTPVFLQRITILLQKKNGAGYIDKTRPTQMRSSCHVCIRLSSTLSKWCSSF